MSKPAPKREWLRRVYFDLHGLPPTPQQLKAFLDADSPNAEEAVVDRLLASPRYGERWARHWMDVARYAETHGHDEDVIREHAWPYRDWIIRALNSDKPYAEFIREQIAGDILAPEDPWATAATGFLACGPWDSSSQMGIQDGTVDKKVAQYLDRDDMLSAAMSTFTSTTVHCARCHDHKFDPVSLEDYYALQAVFAGIDKVDRPFEQDASIGRQRRDLLEQQQRIDSLLGDPVILKEVVAWSSALESNSPSWTVMSPTSVSSSSSTPFEIKEDRAILFGGTASDKDTYSIRGSTTLSRVTAIQVEALADPSFPANGPGRAPNGNLHLSEIKIRINDVPVKIGRTAADFNQAGWEISKAIDGDLKSAWGIHPKVGNSHRAVFVFDRPVELGKGTESKIEIVLEQQHGGSHLIGKPRFSLSDHADPDTDIQLPTKIAALLAMQQDERTPNQNRALARYYLEQKIASRLAKLPEPAKVFAVASQFEAVGNFKPPVAPRQVHVLKRGDIHSPLAPAKPGALSCLSELPSRFDLADSHNEGARRAALADWLAHPNNVLTWRSIVNRVWHYHFGRGIVATPNDFGTMGEMPSHPQLLDWLACEFRQRGGRLKWLHRTIVLSKTYRQSAADRDECLAVDAENRLLWRMERQRLDAESIHDAVLSLSGMLDNTMGGPSARQFHTSKGVHLTPVVEYLKFDPDAGANLRRSVYRFVFRTVPDPLMQALDCPDASQLAPQREDSVTSLQALALLNHHFFVRQAEHIAADLERRIGTRPLQIEELFLRAYGRSPTVEESERITQFTRVHGLANTCRVILNSSEFLHVH